MRTEIKILHASCCSKGSPIKAQLQRIAQANNLSVDIEEFSALKDTMTYGVMTFPALVIRGKVYDFKTFKSEADILAAIEDA